MENSTKMELKLLIDKKSNKVLFGEASKEVVDFIFSLLALPLGAVTKLLSKNSMVGSIGSIYHSLSKLNETYILSNQKTSSLLNPPLASTPNLKTCFLLSHQDTNDRRFNLFEVGSDTISSIIEGFVKGYVKGGVTYCVMDDLTVVPMSTISSITILNKLHIKDLGSFEEKTVSLGFEEGLKMLKASLESKTVLTDVFCRKIVHLMHSLG